MADWIGVDMSEGTDVCVVSQCADLAAARGWCAHHYYKWHRYGDPLGPGVRVSACAYCGGSFELGRTGPRQKYCSDRCRISGRPKIDNGTALCVECGQEFQRKTKRSVCCSVKCARLRHRDSRTKVCSIEVCDDPVRAKGLCMRHYSAERYQREGLPDPVATKCAACGVPVLRHLAKGRRPTCSRACYNTLRGYRTMDGLAVVTAAPNVLPGPRLIRLSQQRPIARLTARARFVAVSCAWCGDGFLFDMRVTGVVAKHCSKRCAKNATKARQRLARGQFKISLVERLKIYERDGWICQLCGDPVDRSLLFFDAWAATLDHIECQAWSLVPDHSPENLRLAHRMCNSLRGDESWAPSVEVGSAA